MVGFVIVNLILLGVFFVCAAKGDKVAAFRMKVGRYFPRSLGRAMLQVSGWGKSTVRRENVEGGCVDLKVRTERVKKHAVMLALTVGASDRRLDKSEVKLIRDWAEETIVGESTGTDRRRMRREVTKAIKQAVKFFRAGNQIDAYRICKEIVEIAPVWQRYAILDLCLGVAKADGVAAREELEALIKFARRLNVDENKFRGMMEKALPVSMHEVEDSEIVLGVRPDMSKEEARQCLNGQYRKWNGRVTHFDPEIRAQAGLMLELIAQTRSERVG